MKPKLLFLAKVLAIGLSLFVLSRWLQPAYLALANGCSSLLNPGSKVPLEFISLDKVIPFAALLLATPKMPWGRKLGMLAVGILIFACLDAVIVHFSVLSIVTQSKILYDPDPTVFWGWETFGRWLLPILLWILASAKYLEELFRFEELKSSESIPE